ncbi:MAG: 2-C-methyl-D-erythritol 4-phosphate cytidylyltransferase [Desulfobacterales bacterium]|nr:2-C-methyl-D-erythritol 4-phosphate cytidylyltransferase [Desulfobacterales bacterium]
MGQAVGIIVAGGQGVRMDAGMRKQYLMLDGRPILGWTLHAIAASPEIHSIYLVVPEADFNYCREAVIAPFDMNKAVVLVAGGKSRQQSVYNGLFAVNSDEGTAVIHDGVRPFVKCEHIRDCIQWAEKERGCILGVPATDTIKQVAGSQHVAHTLDRESLWLAQTPQAFELGYIRRAHEYAKKTDFLSTDDASIIEHYGGRVRIIHGSPWNIKITTPEDLKLAELMMAGGVVPNT